MHIDDPYLTITREACAKTGYVPTGSLNWSSVKCNENSRMSDDSAIDQSEQAKINRRTYKESLYFSISVFKYILKYTIYLLYLIIVLINSRI